MSVYVITKDCVHVEYPSYGDKAPSRCFNVPSIKSFECEYGAFIIRLLGGDFYVDKGNEVAFRILPLQNQPQEVLHAIVSITKGVDYESWKHLIKEM